MSESADEPVGMKRCEQINVDANCAALALLLLLISRYIEGILLAFPLWVLLVSLYILIDNLCRPPPAAATSENESHE